jgi:hypothetical protein
MSCIYIATKLNRNVFATEGDAATFSKGCEVLKQKLIDDWSGMNVQVMYNT